MFFYIFLARTLGPSDFGLFTLSVTVLALVADIGNFGINTGIVNFVSKYIDSDHRRSLKFLKLGLYSKVIISLTVLILGYFLSPYISKNIFSKPELITPLRLMFLGVGTTWMFSFTTSYYQASQKFISWGLIQILTNFIRLASVLVYFYFSQLNLIVSIIFYIAAPLLGFLISSINISFDFNKEKIGKDIGKEFFNFNKWVAIFGGVSAFSSRADTFILGRLATPIGIGIYSAANQLVQVIPQLIGAIGTVAAPKFSSFDEDAKMMKYFKKLQLMVGMIALVILAFSPIVKFIINTFFGAEYRNSFPIFLILLSAMLIFLISIPVHNVIIYYYSYPKLFSYLSIINLLVVFPSAYFLTLKYGVYATAYSILFGNSLNLLIPGLWFLNKIFFSKNQSLIANH
jgi:stage V sporulation protein B